MSMQSAADLREKAASYRAAADQLESSAELVEQAFASVSGLLNGSISTATAHAVVKTKTGRRGRPAGSKNKDKASGPKTGRRGRPVGSKNKNKSETDSGEKKARKPRENTLATMIVKILKERKGGLDGAGLAEECLKRGYKTRSKKFHNVVYQTVNRIVNEEHSIEFNKEDRKFRLVKAA